MLHMLHNQVHFSAFSWLLDRADKIPIHASFHALPCAHSHTAPGATPQTMTIVTYQRLQWMNINARPGHNHYHSSIIQKFKVYSIGLIKELSCPAISYSSPHRKRSIHHCYHHNHIIYLFSIFVPNRLSQFHTATYRSITLFRIYIITSLFLWLISRNTFVDQNLVFHQPLPFTLANSSST